MAARTLGFTSIVAIAAGAHHSVALSSDGTVYTWGLNSSGQLGNNSTTGRSTPAAVSGITAVAIGAGDSHTLIVRNDGTVWGWGANSAGQLGDGTTTQRLTPAQMSGITTATAVAGSGASSFVLLADASLQAVGYNGVGTLGDGTTTQRVVPVAVLTNVASVAAAYTHTIARKIDGTVWTWGGNSNGELGLGDEAERRVPTQVPGLTDISIVAAGTYSSFALTAHDAPLGGNDILYAWGGNFNGQLGDGTVASRSVPIAVTAANFTPRVATPTLSLASGTYTSAPSVVLSDVTAGASIYYTVNGSDPTPSDPQVSSGQAVPVQESLTLKARAVKAGMPDSQVTSATYELKAVTPTFSPSGGTFASPASVTISTTTSGASVRYTVDGTTPTSTSTLYTSPVVVSTSGTLKAVAFKSGWSASSPGSATYTLSYGPLPSPTASVPAGTYEGQVTVALSCSIAGATIRYTTNGSDPTASSTAYTQPLTVSVSTTIKAKAFHPDYATSATMTQAYTIRVSAPVLSLGSGAYSPGESVTVTGIDPGSTIRITLTGVDPGGADPVVASGTALVLGNFTLKARASRTGCLDSVVSSATYSLTERLGNGSVSAGSSHTLIATPDGRVYVFGLNASYQLGDGTTTNRLTPTALPALTGIVAVAAGQAHSLALTSDGHLWAWGSNGSGRLGDGTTTNRSAPVSLLSITSVSAIAAGGSHSLALTTDGEVYAWGLNSSGQLGIGSTTAQSAPTLVLGLSDVVAIAAGTTHSLAVTRTGALYAWGSNTNSQLGDGTTTMRTSPTLIAGIGNVTAIAAGSAHSLARVTGGAVYAWGFGGSGQLGLGTTSNRTVPTLVPALAAFEIAAAGSQSFAQRTDGTLVAWGANSSGQLGDATTSQRNSPTVLSGLPVLAMMDPGDTHTVAITSDGHLWTWGAGGSGQRGDGTTTATRATPQDVFTLASTWGATPPPILSLAPGTYREPQVLTVSHAMYPVTIRYTTTGVDPTETDAEVASGAQLSIPGTRTFRFRAWATGLPPSPVVSASYTLQPLVPAISPSSGTFTTAQTVSMTCATPESTIRYTLDGSVPSDTSAQYTGPFPVSTSSVVSARAFRSEWTPSAPATTAITLNYGTLTAPIATPGTGVYAPGRAVTLTAGAGATIRYTLDGSDPTPASAAYVGPVPLPVATTVLTARAFLTDWTTSAPAQWTYQVTDDTTPPTITATLSPPGQAPDWHTSAVEVTSSCADGESGIASCTPPQTVQRDGSGIEVTGTAIDLAGNSASVSVTLNVDTAAPRVTIYAPEGGDFVAAGTSSVTVRGSAVDFGSGIALLTCNGAAGTVTGQTYRCVVPVSQGANTVTVEASDLVGHSTTTTTAFTVGDPPAPTALVVTPAKVTMMAGETRPLRVLDQSGRRVVGGTWSSSLSTIAAVTEIDNQWVVEAFTAGQVTLTITRDGVTSSTDVTVLAAGAAVPDGTALWELPPSGTEAPKRAQILRAVPTGDVPIDEQPALFYIDEGSEWYAGQLVQTAPVRIVATTMDGQQLWSRTFDEGRLTHVAADEHGGLILVLYSTHNPDWIPQRIRRLDGITGQSTWEYYSYDGELSEVAVHPNGTVYVTEEMYHTSDTFLVALDGLTGAPTRWALPRGHATNYVNGSLSYSAPTWPKATGPIVREDGVVTVVTGRSETESADRCVTISPGHIDCWDDADGPHSSEIGTFLVELRQGAEAPTITATAGVLANATPYRLMPDGVGGVIVAHKTSGWVLRLDSQHQWTPEVDLMPGGFLHGLEAEYVLGESRAYALLKLASGWGTGATLVTFDPSTLAVISTEPVSTSFDVSLRFAELDGSIHMSGPTVGSYGANDTLIDAGLFATLDTTLRLVSAEAETQTSRWSYSRGNAQGANAPRYPRIYHVLSADELTNAGADTITAEQYASELREDAFGHVTSVLPAFPEFYLRNEATNGRFLGLIGRKVAAVALIGHSVTIGDLTTCTLGPGCEAVGLRFAHDRSIVKAGYTDGRDAGKTPDQFQFTNNVSELALKAKILFVGSCALWDTFQSMWNVPDIPTADRAIIVPDVKLAYLNLAGEAWRFLVRDLASGMTVKAAVDKINTDGFLNGRPMKLRIIGGHNVTLN